MHVRSESVKVWLDAKPFTKLTRRRAQPGVAKMRLVYLVTEMILVLYHNRIVFLEVDMPWNTTAFWTRICPSIS